MRRRSDATGQATSEYVMLVALVAAVLALAAGITSGGVAGHVLAGLQHGLCRVADVSCPRAARPPDTLDPCPVERTTSGESLEGAFELVRLGGGGTLSAERRSDGRVTVTLADAATLDGEIGFGYTLALGRRHGGTATARVGTRVASGRSWTLPDAASARAFVARYGAKATAGGKLVDVVRSGCSILCDAIGWRPHATLPPADEISLGRDLSARLGASLGLVGARAGSSRLLGARLLRDGGSTWYTQVDAASGAALLSSAGIGVAARRAIVVSLTLDARHRPLRLGLETIVEHGALAGGRASAGRVEASGRAAIARVAELTAMLDLRDARSRAAAVALEAAIGDPRAAAQLRGAAAAVGRRIAVAGVIDRRVYALTSSVFALGGELSLGAQLGGGFERTRERMRLLSAETRLPGLPFLPRDDCRAH